MPAELGPPTKSARPAAKSGFSSDEAALAAASRAYGRYLEVLDGLSAPEDVGRLGEVATPDYAEELESSLAGLLSEGRRFEGQSSFDSMRVFERWSQRGVEFVSTYVCFDSSGVRVLDASGADVTPPDRIDRLPAVVRFQSAPDDRWRLIAKGSDAWRGNDFCN
ncbi:hypothetical protein [Agromyces silvae]|uniref:hypothetical protein n=1 Tax=Agromyces silvae TaxID=3388266 RepID=UPI00280BAC5C|nr:hypothetical protein [Agromyces protaetiae]